VREKETAMSDRKFVTRREGVKLAREQGIPLSLGRVNKDSMDGRGPKPVGKYGPSDIYTAEEFLRYAVERVVGHAATA
jgi:hypothetical protein